VLAETKLPMERILVGVDGSQAALKAVRAAAQIAGKSGAQLDLVYVMRPALIPPGSPARAAAEKAEQEKATAVLAQAREEVGNHVASGAIAASRSPGEVLCELSRGPEVRLVVVGARGASTTKRLLMGSVSDRVVHQSGSSVLVVR
jgi:nucleotide-binding universal stress UspA family protein